MTKTIFAIVAIFCLTASQIFAIIAKSEREIAKMPKTQDQELKAIGVCLAALRPLTEAARNRVLAYVAERLAAENAPGNGSGVN